MTAQHHGERGLRDILTNVQTGNVMTPREYNWDNEITFSFTNVTQVRVFAIDSGADVCVEANTSPQGAGYVCNFHAGVSGANVNTTNIYTIHFTSRDSTGNSPGPSLVKRFIKFKSTT